MNTHEKWDIWLRIIFTVIGAAFTAIVFFIGQAEKEAASASAKQAQEAANLFRTQADSYARRKTDADERTSLLGAESLVRVFLESDSENSCIAYLALTELSNLASEDGLQQLPKQVSAILSARPNFTVSCQLTITPGSGVSADSFSNAEFRVKAAVDESFSGQANPNEWFAVMLTLKTTTPNSLSRSTAFANQLTQLVRSLGSDEALEAEVWETQQNEHYVVTLGGKTTRAEAEKRVAIVKVNDFVPDAFTQQDKSWVAVTQEDLQEAAGTSQPLAGFKIYVHLAGSSFNEENRLLLLKLLEGLGATVGGFDAKIDSGGGEGIDYLKGSSQAEVAAKALSGKLSEDTEFKAKFKLPKARPNSQISNERTIGLWLEQSPHAP